MLSLDKLKLEVDPSAFAPEGTSNRDLDPVRERDRTWATSDFVSYWLSDGLNVSTWMMGSAFLSLGMSIQYSIPCIFLGHAIVSLPIVLNGIVGATTHVGFPIQSRASFGHHLSKFAVISRAVLGAFWFGVQTYTGSECTRQILISLSPSFRNIPNHLPDSANITTGGMVSFLVFWVIQFPFLLIHPSRIKWFFMCKSILVPICFVSLFIWALCVGGTGPIFKQKTSIKGSALAWAFCSNLNSVIGNYSTPALNIADFSRFAKSRQATLIQALIIPTIFTLAAFIGIVVTSAGEQIYGQILWDPTTLIDRFGDDAKGRAARFFVASSFAFATIGTNISANSISFSSDLTALLPVWINIKRGSIICALLGGWALNPWTILSKATTFLSFMGGYTVFLAPITGILITDYYLVRRGAIDVPALYMGKQGRYYYKAGVNWRAVVALLVPVASTLPGLINSINPAVEISQGLKNLFSLTWLFGFTISTLIYTILSRFLPDERSHVSAPIYAEDVELPRSNNVLHRDRSPEEVEQDEKKDEEVAVSVREV